MKSKKEKLKEQSLKQIAAKREYEKDEIVAQEEAKSDKKLSISGIKLMKKEPVCYMILKILMLVPFLYSGFFYGGITIVAIYRGYIEDIPNSKATFMLVGAAVILVGIFLAFMKKYMVSFIIILAGTIMYMKPAKYIVAQAKVRIDANYVTDSALLKLDKTYMIRHYPILCVLLLSFALLVIHFVRKYLKYRKLKNEIDNAPVKSIVED